ncbi:hypothetical protein BLNAU_8211 [Blattamonas nauphoetae]|uniref:Transmembrane protein n=1 Tax=Blattamonas nauphoetae TaxID=2049346 RepID=A0ABQ9XZ71_9EUKA|nr:hypothetical protein BLNAU_8211 [Blattamonas nauphoetae]
MRLFFTSLLISFVTSHLIDDDTLPSPLRSVLFSSTNSNTSYAPPFSQVFIEVCAAKPIQQLVMLSRVVVTLSPTCQNTSVDMKCWMCRNRIVPADGNHIITPSFSVQFEGDDDPVEYSEAEFADLKIEVRGQIAYVQTLLTVAVVLATAAALITLWECRKWTFTKLGYYPAKDVEKKDISQGRSIRRKDDKEEFQRTTSGETQLPPTTSLNTSKSTKGKVIQRETGSSKRSQGRKGPKRG